MAELLLEQLEFGRNRAVVLGCRSDDGHQVECVVKLSARLDVPSQVFTCEWFAIALGRALGIPVPNPYRVILPERFEALARDEDLRDGLARSRKLPQFGCEYHRGFTQWLSHMDLEELDLVVRASELLVFDALIENTDRRADNPNVLVRRRELLAIDHDLAFEFIHPPPRAEVDAAQSMRGEAAGYAREFFRNHVFYDPLRGKLPDLAAFREAVVSLNDLWFDDLLGATPPEWAASGDAVKIVNVMRGRRNNIERWLEQIRLNMA